MTSPQQVKSQAPGNAPEIRKAERRRSKLRLGLAGPSGAGKTMSALRLAKGLGGRVCMIDTERGSGDLYADLYDYDIITLQPPYKPDAYVQAIHAAEAKGYDVIIVDSLSHAWSDDGGILDQADKLQGSENRFTVWSRLTPQHRLLLNTLLNSPAHIIGTIRSKQEYAMDTDEKGKTRVRKLGLAPVQREGIEYEFTIFMDIEQNHFARVTKDRTNMFRDEAFMIDEKVGERIVNWLNIENAPQSAQDAQGGPEAPRTPPTSFVASNATASTSYPPKPTPSEAAAAHPKKARIVKLMKELGEAQTNASGYSAAVERLTGETLNPWNYDKIIDKLEIQLKEKNPS